MPKIKYVKHIAAFLVILITVIISRNLIITGNIAGVQPTYNIGVLEWDETYKPNDNMKYGINLALSTSLFESFRIENIVRNISNFNSSVEDFKNSSVKAVFAMGHDIPFFELLEMVNKEMLIFSPSWAFSFSELGDSVFFLRDAFLMPVLIMADSMRDYGVKKTGVVYVKYFRSPSKMNISSDNWDYSDEIYNSIFNKIVGEIAFSTTYYLGNKSNSTEILNLVDSTEPEAIAFLGYGTFFEGFSELLSEIKNGITGDIKIFSIGYGSTREVSDFSENFQDIFVIKTDYFPERFWRELLQYPHPIDNIYSGIHFENPDNIHLDLGNEILSLEIEAIDFHRITGKPYPYTVEGYIFVEILKNSIQICEYDINCIKEKLHENTFDTIIGKVKFRKNGVIIRPYLLSKIDRKVRGFTKLKRYTLGDIERLINDYNLDFLN